MNTKPHRTIIVIVCFLFFGSFAFAQEKTKSGVIIQTESKLLMARLMINKSDFIEVKGNAVFRLTAANGDYSLAGLFTYTFTEEERQRIAQGMKKPLDDMPSVVVQENVVAQFQKETECPKLRLTFVTMDLPFGEKNIQFSKFVLEFKFPFATKETAPLSTRILCSMARCLNSGLPCHPGIRRLNGILQGEEDDK